jgi:AcrR family transcriptional regulator
MRVDAKIRRAQIIDAGIKLAIKHGYINVYRNQVAKAAGVSRGLIYHYFKNMDDLRRAIMRTAVERGIAEIVAQGLGIKDKDALKASDELKQKAIDLIATR